jgi:fluoride exporter
VTSDPPPDPRDPDVVPAQRRDAGVLRGQARPTAAVAAGGVLGALARWAVGLAAPTAPGAFPWATFGINVLGSLLMGVLVVVVTEVRTAHPLVRPFLGTGVLGGFTTFSTFAVDADLLLAGGHRATALLYVAATVLAAVGAAALGTALTRRFAGPGDRS